LSGSAWRYAGCCRLFFGLISDINQSDSEVKQRTMPTTRPIKIAPSILTADFGRLAEEIRAAETGGADYIHLDIMDGRFVPNLSFGPTIVKAVRGVTQLPLDVHLMIEDPDRYLADFVEAGANILTVHVETCAHLHRTVQRITELGCRAGVTLNPATPIETLREIIPFVDMVLVMSVNPGFGAQRFIETSTNKLRRVRRMVEEFNPLCDVEVDGGIDVHNIDDVVRSGATVIVVGSAVFNSRAPVAENIAALRAAAQRAMWREV
jgi:ribulose-phosphate 3-epimerase